MATTNFALTVNNSAINNPNPGTASATLHFIAANTRCSFRARGSLIKFKAVASQTSAAPTKVYVNGVYLQDVSDISGDVTVWNGADQWVDIEFYTGGGGALMVTGSQYWDGTNLSFVEVTGASPAVDYMTQVGRYIAPASWKTITSVSGGNLNLSSRLFMINTDGTGVGAVFSATVPSPALYGVQGFAGGVAQNAVAGYNSPVWGQIVDYTSGSTQVAKDHIIRVPSTSTSLTYGFVKSPLSAPVIPANWGTMMVVTGTSIPASPGTSGTTGSPLDTYPDRIMDGSGGLLRVCNMASGGSQLYPWQGGIATSSVANQDQIRNALLLAARPVLWIGHLCNDIGALNTSGVAKTPAEWTSQCVAFVTYLKTQVPALEKVYLCEIETDYRAGTSRNTWQPAQVNAVSQINATYPGLAELVVTDDGTPAFYTTVPKYDAIHPSTTGTVTLANKFQTVVAPLYAPSATPGVTCNFFYT